jgi:hypothetical protein
VLHGLLESFLRFAIFLLHFFRVFVFIKHLSLTGERIRNTHRLWNRLLSTILLHFGDFLLKLAFVISDLFEDRVLFTGGDTFGRRLSDFGHALNL